MIKCAANERSLGQAFFEYSAQNKGSLPWFYTTTTDQKTAVPLTSWDYLLEQTVMKLQNRDQVTNNGTVSMKDKGAWQVFECPADDFPRTPDPLYQNMPVRSYAVNQSKWAYGLSDSLSGVHDGSYRMPWSGGVINGSFSALNVKAAKLSEVPARIWLLGENWGTTSLYTMQQTPDITPANNQAVVGVHFNAALEGSPARFHFRALFGTQYTGTGNGVTSTPWAHSTEASGGNYLYADGHVEFVRFSEAVNIRADTDPKTNGTQLNDHWKWKTSRQ